MFTRSSPLTLGPTASAVGSEVSAACSSSAHVLCMQQVALHGSQLVSHCAVRAVVWPYPAWMDALRAALPSTSRTQAVVS